MLAFLLLFLSEYLILFLRTCSLAIHHLWHCHKHYRGICIGMLYKINIILPWYHELWYSTMIQYTSVNFIIVTFTAVKCTMVEYGATNCNAINYQG